MKKLYLICLTIVTCICVIAGTAIHFYAINTNTAGSWNVTYDGRDNAVVDTAVNAFSAIELDVSAADVSITSGSDYRVKSNLDLTYEVKSDILVISDPKESNLIQTKSYYIEITVPEETALEEVNLSINSGELELGNLQIQNLVTELNSGNTEIRDSSVETLTVSENAGDIEIQDTDCVSMTVSSSTGDVDISGCDFESLAAETQTGEIEVDVTPDRQYAVELRSANGEIEVNGATYRQTFSSGAGNPYVIDLQTTTGDIELNGLN